MTLHRDDFFAFWHSATELQRDGKPLPAITDGKPQGGYYRLRRIKEGPWLPVEFDIDDESEEILAQVNGVPIHKNEHNRVWISCARHPVEWEDFEFRMMNGHWRGELKSTVAPQDIGSNKPPEDKPETIDIILPKELEKIKTWAASTKFESDEAANEASNYVGELRKLRTQAETAHEQEKAPFLKSGREVDERYLPNIKRAKDAIDFLLKKINIWADVKKAEAKKISDAAEAERLRLIKEATERAVTVARETVGAARESGVETTPEPPVIPPELLVPTPPVAKQTFGGITGNKISQRTKFVAVIVDQDACYQHFRDNPEVKEVLLRLANAMVKAKVSVPGVETKEESFVR